MSRVKRKAAAGTSKPCKCVQAHEANEPLGPGRHWARGWSDKLASPEAASEASLSSAACTEVLQNTK